VASILIVTHHEWSARSIDSILAPRGYALQRAYTGHQALLRTRRLLPDAVIVCLPLSDMDGAEFCAALRRDPAIGDHTPIAVISPDPATREARVAALRAGAWAYLGAPLDADELGLRMDKYIRAKLEADRARERGLVDPTTGLYNAQGLARRAREMSSQAARERAPLACIVLSAETRGPRGTREGTEPDAGLAERVAQVFRSAGRRSDVIGRIAPAEFAVLAPKTDGGGAVRLAQRLADAVRVGRAFQGEDRGLVDVRAGYEVVKDPAGEGNEPEELVSRAAMALRTAQAAPGGDWLRQFSP
jgi:diguanylate cyclase (GGDEF)-like protein